MLAASAASGPNPTSRPAPANLPPNPVFADRPRTIADGPFKPTWESLKRYKVPDWFRDAKFGIWAHWTAQCVPEQGDWYARNMYIQGQRQNTYHVQTYGQPGVVLDTVALLLRDLREHPADSMRLQRMRFAETEQKFLAAVPAELRFFFRELIRLARTYTILDDLEHYQTTRINPLAYRAALSLGTFLKTLGVLPAESDVFFLHKADVESLVADTTSANIARCRALCQTNKASYQHALESTPPWSLQPAEAATAPAESPNLLRGLAGSPGRATAPCFAIQGPEDFARFPKGAVLVARTTNPAWTALFYSASAVITESGGPLSHGAVTAREMGLPAVMSVRGVMTRLQNGTLVTVDGSAGTVEITV